MAEKVRSLKDIGALAGVHTTDAKAALLLAYLGRFIAAETPSYSAMANEIGVPEPAVAVLLARLERRGDISFHQPQAAPHHGHKKGNRAAA